MGPKNGPLGSTRLVPREEFPESSCAEPDVFTMDGPSPDMESDVETTGKTAAKEKGHRDEKAKKDSKKADAFEFIRPRKPGKTFGSSQVEFLKEQLVSSKEKPPGSTSCEVIKNLPKNKVKYVIPMKHGIS